MLGLLQKNFCNSPFLVDFFNKRKSVASIDLIHSMHGRKKNIWAPADVVCVSPASSGYVAAGDADGKEFVGKAYAASVQDVGKAVFLVAHIHILNRFILKEGGKVEIMLVSGMLIEAIEIRSAIDIVDIAACAADADMA